MFQGQFWTSWTGRGSCSSKRNCIHDLNKHLYYIYFLIKIKRFLSLWGISVGLRVLEVLKVCTWLWWNMWVAVPLECSFVFSAALPWDQMAELISPTLLLCFAGSLRASSVQFEAQSLGRGNRKEEAPGGWKLEATEAALLGVLELGCGKTRVCLGVGGWAWG